MRTAPKKAYHKLVFCVGNDNVLTQDHIVKTAPGLEDVASPQDAPSFSKDGYVAAIEQQANNWRDFAAEMSCRFEGVKSELDKAVKENALELDRHQRISAEEEERSSSSISSLHTTIVELQDAASGLQTTIASKECTAAAADIKHKKELEALHLAHCAQTEKLSQIQAEMNREHRATRGELEHAETALAQQQNAVADAEAQVHLANLRVQVLESELTSSQQDVMNITTHSRSQVSNLNTLLEDKEGKTREAQQQHEAAEAKSAAQLANLKTRMDAELAALTSQLESEQKRRVAAEEQHKAAQADLALSSEVAEQLKSEQAVLLTQALKNKVSITELSEQATQLQAALNAAHTQNDEAAAVAQHTQAQQQHIDLDIADLTSQLESERRRCAEVAIDHKAAQADLAKQLTLASGAIQKLKSQNAELASQAMKDALAVKDLTDQAAQLRAALTAARAKSTAESGAAGQRAQIMQIIQELNALRAEHAASVDDTQVVHAELEAAKLKITSLKAQLITSHEAADSARVASDSLAQQMRTSADTELYKVVQKVDIAEAEVQHLQCRLANTEADAQSETAKLQLLLEETLASATTAQQDVKRLERQLAGSQNAAAQQQESLKQLHHSELKSQAMKDALTVQELTDQLQAALTAAHDKAGAEAAAAAQHAQVHQQQLDALLADHTASVENTKVVCAELEAAKLQISTLNTQLIMSDEAVDSAKAASDSLAQQMKTSADTELSKAVQQVDAAKAEVQHLQCRLANTQAGAQTDAAKLLLLLDKSRAKAASSEQGVKKLEQQLARSQTAAAQQQERLKKVHQTELKSQIVLAELEAAKLQVTTLKAQLITSHEAADSARAASDSLAQMKTSADTELSKAVQQVDAAKAEVQHLQCLLASTQADAQSEATNLQLLLEKSLANAASAEQEVSRLEQQLTGSQAAAAQQEEELKKVHQKELQAEASKGSRQWEALHGQAGQLRTDLRVAKAKAQDEARDAADYASQLSQQNFALTESMQELQEKLKRKSWWALQAEVKADQEISKLQEQLAVAQANDESAQLDLKRLEQQLAGSQAAAAPKEQELATQVAVTQEQANKLQGQLETALMDLNSLPGVVRSAWFERNRMTAILEAICDDQEHSQVHMVTQVEAIQKLVDALASNCKSVRSELHDAQVDRNRTNSQLENALVKRHESQGQLESATEKYQRLKGQFDNQRSALADLSNQQEQEQHHDAEQPSSELAESHVVQSSLRQQANQEATGPWEDAQHIQQQHFPNSHKLDRNSPQGPPVPPLGTHSSASMAGGDPPEIDATQQQQQCLLMDSWQDLPPGFQQHSILANHAAAQAGDNADAMTNGQEDGALKSAALEGQQHPKPKRGARSGRISREH